MPGVRIALAAGLALLLAGLALTLTGAPARVASSNKVPGRETAIASTQHGASYCQDRELLPRGISAIRVWLDAAAGPRVSVDVYSHERLIASGTRGSNWTGTAVTIPVKALPEAVTGTTVCVTFSLHDETIIVQGRAAPAAIAARDDRNPLAGRMWVEYLRPGTRSWLAQILEVARRMGLGRAPTGTWVALAALALLLAAIALASRLLLRELA
jgi:hypothetical protein